jgi:hypothetical protein
MAIRVEGRMRESFPDREVNFTRSYNKDGNLVEYRCTQTETDYFSSGYYRVSPDNGKTWGEWIVQFEDKGGEHRNVIPGNEFGDEYSGSSGYNEGATVLDPKSGCRICRGENKGNGRNERKVFCSSEKELDLSVLLKKYEGDNRQGKRKQTKNDARYHRKSRAAHIVAYMSVIEKEKAKRTQDCTDNARYKCGIYNCFKLFAQAIHIKLR